MGKVTLYGLVHDQFFINEKSQKAEICMPVELVNRKNPEEIVESLLVINCTFCVKKADMSKKPAEIVLSDFENKAIVFEGKIIEQGDGKARFSIELPSEYVQQRTVLEKEKQEVSV